MSSSLYDLWFKLPTAEFGRTNDQNGDWSLKPVEDIGIAAREEPTDEELAKLTGTGGPSSMKNLKSKNQ